MGGKKNMTIPSSVDEYATHKKCKYLTVSEEAIMSSNKKLTFRDTGLYIYSSADSVLDEVSDGRIQVTTAPASTATAWMAKSSTTNFFSIERVDGVTGKMAINLADTAWLFVNSAGSLKIHTAQPTQDSDGVVVGTQVA